MAMPANNRLLATNMNSAPVANGVQGVLSLNLTSGQQIFYWNATSIAGNFTPNDLVVGSSGKIYVTEHVHGYVMEVQSATVSRVVVKIAENKVVGTSTSVDIYKAQLTDGIAYISDTVLLVGLMTPPTMKGKIFRVTKSRWPKLWGVRSF